jgi:type IV secretory pathway VirJ component
MRGKAFRKTVVFLMVVAFALTSAFALAAEKQVKAKKQEKQWVVIKDKNGKCSVRAVTHGRTEKTIAGPFATKPEAEAAKAKACPPTAKKSGKTKEMMPGKK